jgi:hypothetical protein
MVRCLITVAGLLSLVLPAAAQVATVPDLANKFTKTMQFSGDQAALQTDRIFTVPSTRSFRITDVIVTAFGSGTCLIFFSGKTTEYFVQPKTSVHLQFLSGPTYGPGEDVFFGNDARLPGGSNTCSLTYTIMGYTYRAE